MKDLLGKLNSQKLVALHSLTPLGIYTERMPLEVEPDLDIHDYGGTSEKEYFFRSTLSFAKKYKFILSADLEDYGYVDGENLSQAMNREGTGRLNLRLDSAGLHGLSVTLEGTVNASSSEFGNDDIERVADIKLVAVKKTSSLDIFQELLLEAYSLELERKYRVSFFSYFAALEAFVTSELLIVKADIFKELHNALEHLALDEKLSVLAKNAHSLPELKNMKLWGDFCGLFRKLKDKRNDIAHGKGVVDIKHADVQDIFLVIFVLNSIVNQKHTEFSQIQNFYFPKPAKKKRA